MTGPSDARRRERAALMLVLVTALWGMSFTWTRSWQLAAADGPVDELLSGLTLIAVRMPLALLLLGLWQPRVVLRPTRAEHAGGAAIGAVFFAGFALQTWGLAYTTPALSAFFTSLCSAWVPLIALAAFRERVAPLTLAGLAVGLVGCAVLVEGWNAGPGELMTLAGSVLFAVELLILDRLGRRLEPSHLTAGFLGATGLLALASAVIVAVRGPGLAAWGEWAGGMLARPDILRSVACLVVLPTVLGFHWMNSYQPLVSATRAGLIYLLEPVFSALFSVWWGYDPVSGPLLLGGGLILAGNLLVELPRLLTARRAAG
ncbi:MAG: DMT family transporter [Gemmataceae bacterium]